MSTGDACLHDCYCCLGDGYMMWCAMSSILLSMFVIANISNVC